MKSLKQLTNEQWHEILETVADYCKKDEIPIQAACVYHAMAAASVLSDCSIEAGSATWQFTNVDTGDNPTHFTYQWEGMKGVLFHAANGVMPEVHVWNKYQGLVLDMTTGYLPRQLKKMLNLEWDAPKPPDYFWGNQRGPRQRWLYTTESLATRMCYEWIEEIAHKWARGAQ